MKFGLKTALILSSILIVLGSVPAEASAQGPIVRGLRNRFNDGKPLIPFVGDMEEAFRPQSQPPNRLSPAAQAAKDKARAPNPAGRAPTPASRVPTPATRPTPGRTPTPAGKNSQQKYPPIKLESRDDKREPVSQDQAAAGFGMAIQKSGELFFVSQIDPRGNAAAAGLRRGDVIENIGGAPIKVVEEYAAIAKAMRGGDRVEFEVSRRGSKPEKVIVQFGKAKPVEQPEEPNQIEVAPSYEPTPAAPTKRTITDRYEPKTRSGLRSIYDSGDNKPSSILSPTPAPTPANRVESLELDLPALDGGR